MIVAKKDGTSFEDGLHAARAFLVVDRGRVFAPHLPTIEDGLEENSIADDRVGFVTKLEN